MKILIIGVSGFIGGNIYSYIKDKHTVIGTIKSDPKTSSFIKLDISNKKHIKKIINDVNPDVLINCAGVIENTIKSELNVDFTKNLLEVVLDFNKKIKTIIIGSASEYGVVNPNELPIKESHDLNPIGLYAKSKKKEIEFALKFAEQNGMNVLVARIFNPIGSGMNYKQLLPKVLNSLKMQNNTIEINRLDAMRDYVDVRDVSEAILCLVEQEANYNVYNIGSGLKTSNESLVKGLANCLHIKNMPKLVEKSKTPELFYACQADIGRMKKDFGWVPKYSLNESYKEILNAER